MDITIDNAVLTRMMTQTQAAALAVLCRDIQLSSVEYDTESPEVVDNLRALRQLEHTAEESIERNDGKTMLHIKHALEVMKPLLDNE